MVWFLITAALVGAWALALAYNRWQVLRLDHSGDPGEGIVLFVEPVRWLFVIWGFPNFCLGLRRAGCNAQVQLFRWSNRAGALLVLPDLMRNARLLRKSRRLAALIDDLAKRYPRGPIHVCGYSSGCYVALEALRRCRTPRPVDRLILLAATISPGYDLRHLAGRVRSVHHVYSPLDGWINGLGPLLFGCNDRRWSVSAGMAGLRRPPFFVVQRSWTPRDIPLGYLGGHFTVMSPAFIARELAPLLGAPARPTAAESRIPSAVRAALFAPPAGP
jgi:pimeloyl-ACP methyl ester carboxylesterase